LEIDDLRECRRHQQERPGERTQAKSFHAIDLSAGLEATFPERMDLPP
jgi:hypothetical protein